MGSDGNLLLNRLCGTNIVAIPSNVGYQSRGTKTEPTYVEGIEDKVMTMAEILKYVRSAMFNEPSFPAAQHKLVYQL